MSELRIGLIYIRQSRHKDSERTVSPEVQEAACRALPAIQSCDPVEVYVDLDKSGKSIAKRPDFQRFLDRIRHGPPGRHRRVRPVTLGSQHHRSVGRSLERASV